LLIEVIALVSFIPMNTCRFNSLKLLFISTPVGPLGTGVGGGVELSLHNIAQEMIKRGHDIQIVAPQGSKLESMPVVQIAGNFQIIAQSQERTTPITMPADSVLANMWEYARQVQADYDLVVNFAYDWLPFYLTPFFSRAMGAKRTAAGIAHFVSMGSLSEAMDQIVAQVANQFPGTVGFYTPSQAATFAISQQCPCLRSGIDLSLYEFCSQPKECLAWLVELRQKRV
jgi:UDP-glucose:tetrahydrobiopterin glucosyltransferase